ncbi:MAG: hypothetical protein Q4C81_08700 [Kocuria sp.]|nr:hypothetical protein [Kocuria sp.]
MSASNHSAARPTPDPRHEPTDGRLESRAGTPSGMNLWGWLAVALFITSGIALSIMLIFTWISGGEPVWPWFTRYAYFAFPAAFLCLLLALLQNLLQRLR